MSRNQIIVGILVIAAIAVGVIVATNRKDVELMPEKPKPEPSKQEPVSLPEPPEKRLLTNIPTEPKAFLAWAAEGPGPELNVQALDAIGRLSGAFADEILAKALARDEDGDFEDEDLAGSALLAKARRGDPGLMPALADLLRQSDEDWDVDMLIARALGEIPGERSLNMLVTIVNREDADEDTCQVAIRSLAKKDGAIPRDAIKSLLDHEDENVQATAAAVLLRFGDADAKRLIEEYFADPEASDWDEDVLATSLGVEGSTEALPWLLTLSAHEYWDTRQLAIRALGATRLPDARKALMDSLADEDEDVAVTAAVTLLREFGDETGVDRLVATIESSKDPELVTDAVRVLADLDRPAHGEMFAAQFAVKAIRVEQLLGKLWAAYAILKSTNPK